MPLIFIAVFVLFLFIAPKPFKTLLTIHIVSAVLAFIALLFLAIINGGLKTGLNSGMYEEESIYLLFYALSSFGTMLLGIIAGIIVKIFFD